MFDAREGTVGCGVIVYSFDGGLGLVPLLLDQSQGADQMSGKVFGVSEEVGEGSLNVGIGWRLSTERAQFVHRGV
jgi:hypothetical protein